MRRSWLSVVRMRGFLSKYEKSFSFFFVVVVGNECVCAAGGLRSTLCGHDDPFDSMTKHALSDCGAFRGICLSEHDRGGDLILVPPYMLRRFY